MHTSVSNEMLYELLKSMDGRLERVEKRLDRIEDNQYKERERLDEVYAAREKVKITFGWQWGMVSFFIALTASVMTKLMV